MLTSDENSGAFTFLVGLIVVVMVGVGLSLMADRKFRFISSAHEIRREIEVQDREIGELADRRDRLYRELDETTNRLLTGSGTLAETTALSQSTRQRLTELANNRARLLISISTIEGEFSKFRSDYRRKTWADAVGEDLGDLTIRGGRTYARATITKVTDVGLEIRHEHGIARVQGPDLTPEWQNRFQWNEEERRRRLREEMKLSEENPVDTAAGQSEPVTSGAKAIRKKPESKVIRRQKTDEEREKSAGLRKQVIAWNAKVDQLNSAKNDAASRASYGNQASVPGSLETWSARSLRLGGELGRARAGLSAAKANLAVIAPDDPLLHEVEEER